MARVRNILTALLGIPAVIACASILDIKDAKHDPQLDSQDSGGGATLCDRYCDAVQAACTNSSSGNFQQYISKTVCLDICKQLPAGSESDVTGNSVGCRLHFAQSAAVAGELSTNCPAAGPGGDGLCGSNCEGLCKIDHTTCTGSNANYQDEQQCLNDCSTVRDTSNVDSGTAVPYNTTITSGGTVQCRLYHVGAAQTDPTLHCPHVAGAGPCSGP